MIKATFTCDRGHVQVIRYDDSFTLKGVSLMVRILAESTNVDRGPGTESGCGICRTGTGDFVRLNAEIEPGAT